MARGTQRPNSQQIGGPVVRTRGARSSRRWRPDGVQALEGRALMASALAPSFNGGQALIAPTGLTNPASTNTNDAVAVQSDGKVVVAGVGAATDPTTGDFAISVRRYNADGTLDSTFGTGGQAHALIPPGSATAASVAHSLLILPSGRIVLDVNLSTTMEEFVPGNFDTTYFGSDVVAFDANGALDTSFGTKGIASFTTDVPSFTNLVAQPDGKILLGGVANNPDATPANVRTAVLTRLDADGSVDSSFGGGSLLFPPGTEAADGTALSPIDTSGLGLTTAGKIKVVSDYETPTISTGTGRYGVLQLNTDGTVDTTYGTNGLTTTTPDPAVSPLATASVLPSGQVVLVATNAIPGETGGSSQVSRLNADGTVDSSFGTVVLAFGTQSAVVGTDGTIVVAGGATASGLPNLPIQIARITGAGKLDTNFGPGGTIRINVPNVTFGSPSFTISDVTINTPARVAANALALTADGNIVVAGTASYSSIPFGSLGSSIFYGSQSVLAVAQPVGPSIAGTNDYNGDGKSDIAAELSTLGAFAYRTSAGDTVQPFGPTGPGAAIPAPGDYDGDGKTDVAAYLPAYGVLAYRPSTGGADQLIRFGPVGAGAAIPVPGDYDGDGKTDVALFVPSQALYLIDPSSGAAPYAVQFGAAGAGQSIPVPGDYDGSGKTELAVYLPAYGALAYRPAGGGADKIISFGPAGLGASIPVAGDFDGDGKDDVALYLPSSGTFAIDPSGGSVPYAVQFGAAGAGQSIPLSGDYDGDGRTDLAVYLPSFGTFAYRPSGGGSDVLQAFGTGGTTTVPAAALIDPTTGTTVEGQAAVSAQSLAGLVVYQPDADGADAQAKAKAKKAKA